MHSVRSGRKRRLAALGAALSLALGIAAGSAAPAVAHGDEVRYIALGDSYSSGQGAGGEDPVCLRGPNGYPDLIGASDAYDVELVENRACRETTTTTLLTRQLLPPARSVGLVTLTVGGNDAGFAGLVAACPNFQLLPACRAILTITPTEEFVLTTKLRLTYAAVRAGFPSAHVVVLGYPRLFTAEPSSGDFFGAVVAAGDRLNGIIERAAGYAGVTYVGVADEFDTHEVPVPFPAPAPDSWIGADPTNGITFLHPNAAGYREGYVRALDAAGVLPR